MSSKDNNYNLPENSTDLKPLKPLKALLINGPNVEITAEIRELYNQSGALIIGDGKSEVNINIISEKLKEQGYKVTEDTRIDINAHGIRDQKDVHDFDHDELRKIKYKQHAIALGISAKNRMVNTKDFFQELRKEFKRPLYVHIWSCYGGSANKAANYLGPGSIMISHVDSKNTSWSSLSNHALFSSVKNHLNNDLPLHKKIIDALAANTQTMTINLVKAPNAFDNEGKKFSHKFPDENGKKVNIEGPNELIFIKTARTLKPIELEKLINELEKNQPISQAVANFLQADIAEFKQREDFDKITEFVSKRFGHKLQKKDLDDIAQYIDDDVAKKYLLGSAAYLAVASKEKDLKTILEFFKVIKDRGINLIDQTALNPLNIATYENRIDIIDWFIDEKNNPDIVKDSKAAAITYAAQYNNFDILKHFFAKGIDINSTDNHGLTMLLKAAEKNNKEMVGFLLDNGADINSTDNHGLTMLLKAAEKNNKEMVGFLLDNGADINARDSQGWSSLIYAAYDGNKEMVRFLLERGADVNLTSPHGTALEIAKRFKQTEIVDLITKASEARAQKNYINNKPDITVNTKEIVDLDINKKTKNKLSNKSDLVKDIKNIGRTIRKELADIGNAFNLKKIHQAPNKKPQKKDSRHR